MKKIINYFIRYHVAVNVIIIAFLLFGILGVKSLKSSFFPLTESHLVQIAVSYPGASPMEIEEGVILKIEDKSTKLMVFILASIKDKPREIDIRDDFYSIE